MSLSDRIKRRIFQCDFGEICAWGGYYQTASTSSPPHRERLKSLFGCRILRDDDKGLKVQYFAFDFEQVWNILNSE